MNVGFMTMNNLQLPSTEAPEENASTSNGLLARNTKPKSTAKTSKEPRNRIAGYVAELRQARLDLKNG